MEKMRNLENIFEGTVPRQSRRAHNFALCRRGCFRASVGTV
jgi:hypothetical protein